MPLRAYLDQADAYSNEGCSKRYEGSNDPSKGENTGKNSKDRKWNSLRAEERLPRPYPLLNKIIVILLPLPAFALVFSRPR